MNLKFHMQHDQTAGLQTCKSQPGRDSKMVADTKNRKNIKINFFNEKLTLLTKYAHLLDFLQMTQACTL